MNEVIIHGFEGTNLKIKSYHEGLETILNMIKELKDSSKGLSMNDIENCINLVSSNLKIVQSMIYSNNESQ